MDVYSKIVRCVGLRDQYGIQIRLMNVSTMDVHDAVIAHTHEIERVPLNETEYIIKFRVKLELIGTVKSTIFTCVLSHDNLVFVRYAFHDEETKEPLILLDA